MNKLILTSLLLASTAHAQGIECPKFYPWQDTPLSEVPHEHKGKGIVAKAKLTGASMYAGEMGGQGELHGDRKKVRGGWDVQYGFAPRDARWLVCSYGGGDITWWEQLSTKATRCKLEVRETGGDPMSAKLACK